MVKAASPFRSTWWSSRRMRRLPLRVWDVDECPYDSGIGQASGPRLSPYYARQRGEAAVIGILLVVLGLVVAGVVAEFVVENGLSTSPEQTFQLLGGSFHLSRTELVLGAAVLGAVSILFLVLGLGLLRGSWGRRRGLKLRIADLERENSELRSRAHLAAAVRAETSPEHPVVPDEEG